VIHTLSLWVHTVDHLRYLAVGFCQDYLHRPHFTLLGVFGRYVGNASGTVNLQCYHTVGADSSELNAFLDFEGLHIDHLINHLQGEGKFDFLRCVFVSLLVVVDEQGEWSENGKSFLQGFIAFKSYFDAARPRGNHSVAAFPLLFGLLCFKTLGGEVFLKGDKFVVRLGLVHFSLGE